MATVVGRVQVHVLDKWNDDEKTRLVLEAEDQRMVSAPRQSSSEERDNRGLRNRIELRAEAVALEDS